MAKKEDWYESEKDDRPFFKALVYTREGDLDISWLLLLLFGLTGVAAVIKALLFGAAIPVQIATLSFLGAAFMAVLIAAIPIAKARILANSKLPSEVAKSIASTLTNVETSTDVQELYERHTKTLNESEIG